MKYFVAYKFHQKLEFRGFLRNLFLVGVTFSFFVTGVLFESMITFFDSPVIHKLALGVNKFKSSYRFNVFFVRSIKQLIHLQSYRNKNS